MKKSIFAIAALAALVSCQSLKEEWQPVFTCGDPGANLYVPVTEEYLKAEKGLEEFTSIADLKALYKGEPVVVDGNVWIKGQVISSDENGNIYNEIYLQDATGGIDLKIGKGSTHNEYPLGQWVYVKCDGFTLGAYNGMPQLGMQADQTETNEYETSYINLPGLIETHIFRGFVGTPIVPKAVDESAIAASISKGYKGDLWGTLVTIKGLVYDNQIFALVYPNPNLPHKKENPENRVFLSDNGTERGMGQRRGRQRRPAFQQLHHQDPQRGSRRHCRGEPDCGVRHGCFPSLQGYHGQVCTGQLCVPLLQAGRYGRANPLQRLLQICRHESGSRDPGRKTRRRDRYPLHL